MLEQYNIHSQPPIKHKLFNRWDRLPEAWYFTLPSDDLKPGEAKSFALLDQKFVLYRGQSGKVYALDAFCPHMGTDLALGEVKGERIRCFFHHWEYSGDGICQRIPCLDNQEEPRNFGHNSYPVCEKYGLVWLYAGKNPLVPVLEVPDLKGKNILYSLGTINTNRSHHHISMINGLDPQHLRTVHNLGIDMKLNIESEAQQIQFTLEGLIESNTLVDRTMRFLFGKQYSYAMKYSQASIASLTILRNVYFQSPSWPWPRLHMLYAYRPVSHGVAETQPIYVAELGSGPLAWVKAKLRIFLTKRAYFFLKDEDDKVYDHIRFNSQRLLPMDSPLATYIEYVNQLNPAIWTREERAPCLDPSPVTASMADGATTPKVSTN